MEWTIVSPNFVRQVQRTDHDMIKVNYCRFAGYFGEGMIAPTNIEKTS